MTDRNFSHLDKFFQPTVQRILDAGHAADIDVRLIETWRDSTGQAVAQATGKSKAGFGDSPHNWVDAYGNPAARAFDYGVFEPDGSYCADGKDPRYAQIGSIAVALGLEWGGNWTPEKDGCEPDFDHIQMVNWRSL